MALNGAGDIVLTTVVHALGILVSSEESSTGGRMAVCVGIPRHHPRSLDFAREFGGWRG